MALTQPAIPEVHWSLGELMWKARKDAGLDQQAIAEQLGVSRALVGHWENDRSEPSYRRLVKFAQATQFPLEILLSAIGYISNDAGEPTDLSLIPCSPPRRPSAYRQLPLVASVR